MKLQAPADIAGKSKAKLRQGLPAPPQLEKKGKEWQYWVAMATLTPCCKQIHY